MSEFKHLLIRASAGTGKTFRLSNRYILLLCNDVDPRDILATTFTRKAAGEIRDRILERIAAAVLDEETSDKLVDQLSEESGSALTLSFESAFNLILEQLHLLKIGTLDSFFAKWAIQLGFEYGLTPGWSVLSTTEYNQYVDQAINEVIQFGKNSDLARLLMLLNKGQVRRSVSDQIREAVKGLRDIHRQSTEEAWTYPISTNPVSKEVLEAALAQLEEYLNADEYESFHKVINEDVGRMRRGDYQKAATTGILKKLIEGESRFGKKEIPTPVLTTYQTVIDFLKHRFTVELHNQTTATFDLLTRFETAFSNAKQRHNQLEFTDVTTLAGDFGNLPPAVIGRLSNEIEHLMLDEFQDTSVPQWNAISRLVYDLTKLPGGVESSLFCVGDVKQAIYGWRGGRREIFNTLSASVANLSDKGMKKSWRSSDVVLQFVNKVFCNLTAHPALGKYTPILKHWVDDFPEHETELDLPGYIQFDNASAGSNSADRVHCALQAAVEKTIELINTNKAISIGILVRKNIHIATLISELNQRGIRASEEGGNPLTHFHPVQLVQAWLHLLEFPEDKTALFRISQSPLRQRLAAPDHLALSDAILNRERQNLLDIGLSGYLHELCGEFDEVVTSAQRSRLNQMISFADSFSGLDPLRLTEFNLALELESFADESTSTVRVMTVHQSKGLEFDAVILPTLDNTLTKTPKYVVSRSSETQLPQKVFAYRSESLMGILPAEYTQAVNATLTEKTQEALCVLYVAMTRAVHALYLIGPCNEKPPKTPPTTIAALIQLAVTDAYDQTPDHTIYREGKPDWFSSLPDNSEPMDDRPLFQHGLQRTAQASPQELPTASPSSLEGGTQFKVRSLLRKSSTSALEFGTLVHKAFEYIQWWNPNSAQESLAALQHNRIVISEPLSSLLHSISPDSEIAKALSRHFYQIHPVLADTTDLRVFNELPVTAIVDEQLIRGFADRIVLGFRGDALVGADIIDFKTDWLGDDLESLPERLTHYTPQLTAYRATVAQMFKLPVSAITARLLFIRHDCHQEILFD